MPKKTITILFEGDSLTANNLNKVDASIGSSYPFFSVEILKKRFPDIEFVVYNEAVFGNKTFDVQQRIATEIEKYRPDIVSVFIGVNNALSNCLAEFNTEFASILGTIKASGSKLLVVEPYLNYNDIYGRYLKRKHLIEINEMIKNIIVDRADAFIPLDGLFFNEFLNNNREDYFVDGLHLSKKGAEFIGKIHAEYLCELVKKIEKENSNHEEK